MDILTGELVAVGDGASALAERFDGTLVPGEGGPPLPAARPIRVVGNLFNLECYGPDGALKWREDFPNAVTLAGLDDVLNVYLGGAAATSPWYLGLVDNAGFTTFGTGDTMSSHSGWSENTSYSGSVRPSWTPAASSGQAVSNTSTVNFSVTGSATIRGLFLCSSSARGGTDGKLFSTAAFSGGNQPINSGDTLKATYTVSATSS